MLEEIARAKLGWHGTPRPGRAWSRTLRPRLVKRLTLAVEVENRFRDLPRADDEAAIETVGDSIDADPEEACETAGADDSLTSCGAPRASSGEGLRLLDRRGARDVAALARGRRPRHRVAGGLQRARRAPRRASRARLSDRRWRSSTPSSARSLAGAVPVPLYPPMRLGRLDEYHAQHGADDATRRRPPGARRPSRLDACSGRRSPRATGPRLRRRDSLEDAPSPGELRVRREDLGLVQFSSGTTARAETRGAHASRAARPGAGAQRLPGRTATGIEHSGVSWLPLYHDMGLSAACCRRSCAPGHSTLIPPEVFVARPALWLRAISPLPRDASRRRRISPTTSASSASATRKWRASTSRRGAWL